MHEGEVCKIAGMYWPDVFHLALKKMLGGVDRLEGFSGYRRAVLPRLYQQLAQAIL
jgi:hypothetical protein